MSHDRAPGAADMSAGPDLRSTHRRTMRRFLAPFARLLAWWGGLFALLSAFAVCPFCGQAGCAGGASSAGVLGGFTAIVVSVIKRRRQPRASCRGLTDKKECSDHAPPMHGNTP